MTDRPKRIIREFTPEESARWRRAVQEEEAARPANSARALRHRAAIEEQTVSGELRRAIGAALPDLQVREVAEQADVPFEVLNAFMGGEAPLDSDQFSRIAAVLNYHLAPSV